MWSAITTFSPWAIKGEERELNRDSVLPRTKCCRIETRALLVSLSFIISHRLERLPLLRGKPVCFQQSSIALSVCMFSCMRVRVRVSVWVCGCQRIGSYRLAGCNPSYRLIRSSFSIVRSLWFCARGSVVVSRCSSSYSVTPWFRTPAVPPWFLMRVQYNTTTETTIAFCWGRTVVGMGTELSLPLSLFSTDFLEGFLFFEESPSAFGRGSNMCVRTCECLCWVCCRLAGCNLYCWNRFSCLLSLYDFLCVSLALPGACTSLFVQYTRPWFIRPARWLLTLPLSLLISCTPRSKALTVPP